MSDRIERARCQVHGVSHPLRTVSLIGPLDRCTFIGLEP